MPFVHVRACISKQGGNYFDNHSAPAAGSGDSDPDQRVFCGHRDCCNLAQCQQAAQAGGGGRQAGAQAAAHGGGQLQLFVHHPNRHYTLRFPGRRFRWGQLCRISDGLADWPGRPHPCLRAGHHRPGGCDHYPVLLYSHFRRAGSQKDRHAKIAGDGQAVLPGGLRHCRSGQAGGKAACHVHQRGAPPAADEDRRGGGAGHRGRDPDDDRPGQRKRLH